MPRTGLCFSQESGSRPWKATGAPASTGLANGTHPETALTCPTGCLFAEPLPEPQACPHPAWKSPLAQPAAAPLLLGHLADNILYPERARRALPRVWGLGRQPACLTLPPLCLFPQVPFHARSHKGLSTGCWRGAAGHVNMPQGPLRPSRGSASTPHAGPRVRRGSGRPKAGLAGDAPSCQAECHKLL